MPSSRRRDAGEADGSVNYADTTLENMITRRLDDVAGQPASGQVPTLILSQRSASALLVTLRHQVLETASPVRGTAQGVPFSGVEGIDLLLRRIRLRNIEAFELTDSGHGTRHIVINFWGQ
jgi:hypothetical protein